MYILLQTLLTWILESQKFSAVADETYLGPLSVCPGESQTLSTDAAGPSVAHHELCLFLSSYWALYFHSVQVKVMTLFCWLSIESIWWRLCCSLACVSSTDSALSRSRLCCSLACLSSDDSALSRSRLCCSLACPSSGDSALCRSRLCCTLTCLSSVDSALSWSRLCCSLASLCKLCIDL